MASVRADSGGSADRSIAVDEQGWAQPDHEPTLQALGQREDVAAQHTGHRPLTGRRMHQHVAHEMHLAALPLDRRWHGNRGHHLLAPSQVFRVPLMREFMSKRTNSPSVMRPSYDILGPANRTWGRSSPIIGRRTADNSCPQRRSKRLAIIAA